MNRIIIGNDQLITIVEDTLIELSDLKNVNLEIKIKKDCILYIKTNNLIGNLNIVFDIESNVIIKRLTNNDNVDELITFNFNTAFKQIEYNMFGYVKFENTFKVILNHLNNNIKSFLKVNLVNKDKGNLTLDINSYTGLGIVDCVSDQVSNIINLGDTECKISPNMYIASKDIIATHTAFIGNIRKEELFYLMSKSLDEKIAKELLITSFVWQFLNEEELEYFS